MPCVAEFCELSLVERRSRAVSIVRVPVRRDYSEAPFRKALVIRTNGTLA
jgi:hypothetical protein